MLLPTDDDEDDDEEGDPRAELVRKLLEYQAYKHAAQELGSREADRAKVFTRQVTDYYLKDLDPEDGEIDTFSANFYDLIATFQTVITKHGRKQMHEVYEEMISIEEKMYELQSLLNEKKSVKFFDLFQAKWTKNELIATFLAILEIVKTRFAFVKQDKQFSDIFLEKREEQRADEVPV